MAFINLYSNNAQEEYPDCSHVGLPTKVYTTVTVHIRHTAWLAHNTQCHYLKSSPLTCYKMQLYRICIT